jgi:hypothetical protein
MYEAARVCLQLDYRTPDPLPDALAVPIGLIAHFPGASCCSDRGFVAMFSDQQSGRSPNIGVGNHKDLHHLSGACRTERSSKFATAGVGIGRPF